MRPDPHKKKYPGHKKRGGAGAVRGAGRGADKEKPGRAGGGQRWEDRQRGAQAAGPAAGPMEPHGQDDAAPQEDIEGSDQLQRKSYRRRQVESNWQRYEDVRESTEVEPVVPLRGADFGVLLKEAGDALSQFRFQDEMAWEEDEDEESAPTADLMSLNCQDLAAALQCIPLHVRLGIEDIVPEYLEHQFEAEAEKHRVTYKPVKTESLSAPAPEELTIVSSIAEEVIDDIVPAFDLDIDARTQTKSAVAPASCTDDKQFSHNKSPKKEKQEESKASGEENCKDLPTSEENNDNLQRTESHTRDKSSNNKKADNKDISHITSAVQTCENVDDELDFLLGLDAPSQLSNKDGRDGDINSQPHTESTSKVIDSTNSSLVSNSKALPDTQADQKTKEDELEDWLDSVLED